MAEQFPDIGLPDWGLSEQSKINTIDVQFGDGYHLRGADGINYRQGNWSPVWSHLMPAVAEDAFEWLDSRKGITAFDWPHPKLGIKRVLCTSVSLTHSEYGNSTLSVTLVQDFNP